MIHLFIYLFTLHFQIKIVQLLLLSGSIVGDLFMTVRDKKVGSVNKNTQTVLNFIIRSG